MKVDSFIHGVTSTVTSKFKINNTSNFWNGTGFFYQIMDDKDINGFQRIGETYLITNRHMLFEKNNGKEILADKVIFCLKKIIGKWEKLRWKNIELNRDEILNRAKIFEDSSIDVVAIRVGDLMMKGMIEDHDENTNYIAFRGITKRHFPKMNNDYYDVEVGDTILIIGYPHGYFDSVNLYPIVKSGVIATSLYHKYEGSPCFLIDAKLFPGSSGSLVISQPRIPVKIYENGISYYKEKQFEFLGIFSGEPHLTDPFGNRQYFDVGKVWFWQLLELIMTKGISINK